MICVSIGTEDKAKQNEFIEKYEFIEYRLDLCKPSESELLEIIKKARKIILTFREHSDLYYLKNLPYSEIDYFDFDHSLVDESISEFLDIIRPQLIISYHLPEFNHQVVEISVKSADELKPSVIKVAVPILNDNDLDELFTCYSIESDSQLLLIGSGLDGQLSRINAIIYGAPFTYASPERGYETGDGQMTYEEMQLILNG